MLYREPLLGSTRKEILEYISSMDEDKLIVCEVLEVLEAHVEELKTSNNIPLDSANRILSELKELKKNPWRLFSYKTEDVHEAIEVYLYEKLGSEAGYLALGRSRNDHVAAALRLKIARMLLWEALELVKLRRVVLSKALEHSETPMPFYTHMQPAQVSTVAHYMLYVDELIATYLELLPTLIDITLRSPLGSGPVAGVMTPIDRERIASKLFNGRIVYNTLYATSSRDFILLALAFNSSLLISLSRIFEDLIVFSASQIDYFKLPEEHLATSSIMPHKRNPVTMEVARAKAGEMLGYYVSVASIVKGIMSGYNLDLQEANKHALIALRDAIETINMIAGIFEGLKVNMGSIKKHLETYPLMLTDIAELVALKTGRPFREVHREIAVYIRYIRKAKRIEEVYRILEETYNIKLDPHQAIRRPVIGSPNPEYVRAYVEKHIKSLEVLETKLLEYTSNMGSECQTNGITSLER